MIYLISAAAVGIIYYLYTSISEATEYPENYEDIDI
jgi:hypothetical protein